MTKPEKLTPKPYLSPQSIAAELDIPISSARMYMLGMKGVFRIGRHLRIQRLDFERWITRQQDQRTSESTLSRRSRPIVPRTGPREC